jgi:hypothetical protein
MRWRARAGTLQPRKGRAAAKVIRNVWRHSHNYALDSSAAERRCFIASTPILGAILLTVIVPEPLQGTLRVGACSFEILFPVIFAVVMWGWRKTRTTAR